MIAVVMTYYDREPQVCKTLASLKQSAHNDFRVIVVDDASPIPLNYNGIDIVRIEPSEKKWKDLR